MISRMSEGTRWLRRRISRSRLAANLFGHKVAKGVSTRPGLIIIQLDGLSRTQMEVAMEKGRLPFLRRLIRERHFALESFYSGMPSTTPAVQGEIFYNQRGAVPAFHFFQRRRGRAVKMYEADVASELGAKLENEAGPALLRGGRSYSNIYRAGAAHSRYCPEDFAPNEIFRKLHPLKSLLLSLVYAPKILRMLGLALLEFALALVDLIKGLYRRRNWIKEFQFVPTRIAVCVLLRELIRFRVLLDIERGERIVHANFLGYDEQAHRRGPDSAFAHWSLRGIDGAIRDIYRAAHRSDYRDYELIVYSDHGQERTESFERRNGRTLQAAISEVFEGGATAGLKVWQRPAPVPELMGQTVERCEAFFGLSRDQAQESRFIPDAAHQIALTAMGPIGHIYVPRDLSDAEKADYARGLVAAGVPLVLVRMEDRVTRAFNRQGEWELLKDPVNIFGAEHPFLQEVAQDTDQLSRHPDAGDFVINGWDPKQPALSFPLENGAHGGPGPEETHGFLLLPDRIRRWHLVHLPTTAQRVRGEELRQIALHYLGDEGPRVERVARDAPRSGTDSSLRIMSYNLHSCRGLDGKVRPERIARVINAFDPDLVAVQEVDAHRASSGSEDQAHLIASHLRMEHVFQTMLEKEGEDYGIAIFSKHPFQQIRAGFLTQAGRRREGRGAICLRVTPNQGRSFYFINTHFGLGRAERKDQASRLLGEHWLGRIPKNEPVILCGDFNSLPRSRIYRQLTQSFKDVWQGAGDDNRARPGFPSIMPLFRLDHIFLSDHFDVSRVEVPGTSTAKVASDHLPLCAELEWRHQYDDGKASNI